MTAGKVKTVILAIIAAASVAVISYNLYVLASGAAPKAPTGLHIKRKG